MIVELLGKTQLFEKGCTQYFLLSSSKKLSEIELCGKKIALFTTGKCAESLLALKAAGIKIDVLCNSNPKLGGRHLFGYSVISSWDIIRQQDNYYIIIPETGESTRQSIMRQLLYHGVSDFSIIRTGSIRWPDFDEINEGDLLKNAILSFLNQRFNSIASSVYDITWEEFRWSVDCLDWWHPIFEWIYEEHKSKDSMTMLDIGPGKGTFSIAVKHLLNITIDWVDLSASRYLPDFINHDIINNVFHRNVETEDIPEDNTYDIIVMTEVIEHFNYNPVPTLKKLKKHLNPGGVFYLSTPHDNNHYSYKTWRDMPNPGEKLLIDYHDHVYEYTDNELHEILEEAGFTIARKAFSISGNSNFELRPVQ